MQEQYVNDYSPILGRHMEMLIFGHAGRPVILYPTSMGKYYQNKDFKLIEAASWFIQNGLIKIYCPDSVDNESWYNYDVHPATRAHRHMQYDAYIRHEVLPRALHETGHSRAIMAGCSFGGYHAMNFGLRYPGLTSHIFSMGGAFDIRGRVFGYYDDNIYFNNPVDFAPNLSDGALYGVGIVLGVGEHDFCIADNYRMSEILARKGINHWLDIRPGANHDWPVWREMFPHYLSEAVK
jgi:esterase/lipase superfamily enzyme